MSIAVRRSLALQLQRFRLAAGKSVADVAASGIVAKSTLQSIENAERPIKVAHVMSLCQLYHVEDEETVDRLVKMAQNKEKGWWEDFRDVIDDRFRFFIELESAADRVYTYDSELLYGLLQTPAYHRAIFEAERRSTNESVDREVQFRIDRQRATLERTPALQVTAIINEGVLVRQVGGKKAVAELRDHLLVLSRRPNVELSILPGCESFAVSDSV